MPLTPDEKRDLFASGRFTRAQVETLLRLFDSGGGGSGPPGPAGPAGPTGPTGPQGPAGSPLSEVIEVAASRDLALPDVSAWLEANNDSSLVVLTLPPQSSVAWPQDSFIEGSQRGGEPAVFIPGNGVTITVNAKYQRFTDGPGAWWALKRLASDRWLLYGDLAGSEVCGYYKPEENGGTLVFDAPIEEIENGDAIQLCTLII
jgi:hypothetical protein